MLIERQYSSRRTRARQSVCHWPTARMVLCLMSVVAMVSWGSGCSSIYHRTRTQLPPDPAAELSLRMTEARQAERQLQQAGRQLRDHLRRGEPATTTETDFDRLQAATLELERRLGSASHAAERGGGSEDFAAEMERLRQLVSGWRTYVEANRTAGPATQRQQLEVLLGGQPAVD